MPTVKTTKAKLTRTGATATSRPVGKASAIKSRLAKTNSDIISSATTAGLAEDTDMEETAMNRLSLNLPEPEDLAKYEKIIPGGAERILELAEQQASHSQELESRQLETSAKLKLVRQVIIFFLALGAGALGAALLLDGSELAGLLVIVIDAAALAAVSLHNKQA